MNKPVSKPLAVAVILIAIAVVAGILFIRTRPPTMPHVSISPMQEKMDELMGKDPKQLTPEERDWLKSARPRGASVSPH